MPIVDSRGRMWVIGGSLDFFPRVFFGDGPVTFVILGVSGSTTPVGFCTLHVT